MNIEPKNWVKNDLNTFRLDTSLFQREKNNPF